MFQKHIGKGNQFFYDMRAPSEDQNNQGKKRKSDASEGSKQKKMPPKPTGERLCITFVLRDLLGKAIRAINASSLGLDVY